MCQAKNVPEGGLTSQDEEEGWTEQWPESSGCWLGDKEAVRFVLREGKEVDGKFQKAEVIVVSSKPIDIPKPEEERAQSQEQEEHQCASCYRPECGRSYRYPKEAQPETPPPEIARIDEDSDKELIFFLGDLEAAL